MATTIEDLWQRPSLTTLKAFMLSTAETAGLPVTSWVLGEPSERWTEILPRAIDNFLGAIITKVAQSAFLEAATDPGDPGDDDPDQTPRAGWLSALGEGTFGTARRGQTFATTTVTLTNNNAFSISPAPGEFVFQRDFAEDDGGFPTYTTTPDASIYVNAGGTVTILPGDSAELPVQADIIGTYSDASVGDINIVVTGTFGSVSVTNASAALASEREPKDEYVANCRRATGRVATGSPTATYEYAATRDAAGDPLQRHDGSGPVGINRIFVDDGITSGGRVRVYGADPDGGADTVDIASAHANITGIPLGVITEPIGVVPGVVDYDTLTAPETTVAVSGTCKIKSAPGVTQAAVQAAIVAALETYFSTFPITGLDQVPTVNGFMYRNDLEAIIRAAYPGVYAVTTTAPATASVSIPWGNVAVVDTEAADWAVTVV